MALQLGQARGWIRLGTESASWLVGSTQQKGEDDGAKGGVLGGHAGLIGDDPYSVKLNGKTTSGGVLRKN